MSWKIKQKLRALLTAETNLCSSGHGRSGDLSVCLVYPNVYRTGMGSLGFQTVYRLLAGSAGIHCERGFRRVTLPPLESDGTTAKWFSRWRRII